MPFTTNINSFRNVPKYQTITFNNGASNALFVAKYNPEGKVLWNSRMLTSNTTYLITNMSTDVSNNLYVSGWFTRGTNINDQGLFVYNADGTLARNLSGPSNSTAIGYFLRYDRSGSNDYGNTFTSSINVRGIAATTNRSMFTALNYGTTFIQYGVTTIASGLSGSGGALVFLDSAGNFQWIARMFCATAGGVAYCNYLVTDRTNAYVACDFTPAASATLFTISNYGGGGVDISRIGSTSSGDVCLIRFNNSGSYVWASKMGGTGYDTASALAIDASANVIIGGTAGTTAMSFFNSAETATITYTAPTGLGLYGFLAKYNGSTGAPVWATYILDGNIYNITCDASNNVYVSGYYSNSNIQFYNASAGRALFATLSNYSPLTTVGFIAKYDMDGVGQWAFRTVSSNSGGVSSYHATTLDGVIYNVAGFSTSVNVLNLNGTTLRSLSSSGGADGFLARYNRDVSGAWVTTVGGSTNQTFISVATDGTGNVIVGGSYPSGTQSILNNT